MGEDGPYEIELIPLAPGEPAPSIPPGASIEPIVVVTEDEEIYCPVCSYNLSGIFSGRCPECGAYFDRPALIAAQQANAITLIPWDDPQELKFWERLYRTVRICLLDAEHFAFAFSVRPRESKATSFFVGVLVATVLIGVAASLVFQLGTWFSIQSFYGFADLLKFVCSLGVFIPLTIGTATILSGLFLWIFCPHYDGQRHFAPWLTIAAYAAAHYLMIAAMIPVSFILPILFDRSSTAEFGAVAFSIWLGCGILCVFTLRAVIDWRTSQLDEPRFVILSIGFLHVAAAIVSVFVADYIGSRLTWVIRLFC
jgi:hypothetical protein